MPDVEHGNVTKPTHTKPNASGLRQLLQRGKQTTMTSGRRENSSETVNLSVYYRCSVCAAKRSLSYPHLPVQCVSPFVIPTNAQRREMQYRCLMTEKAIVETQAV